MELLMLDIVKRAEDALEFIRLNATSIDPHDAEKLMECIRIAKSAAHVARLVLEDVRNR